MAQDGSARDETLRETPGETTGGTVGATARKRKAAASGYSVGYGKPPLHTRFRKGHSGNPSGRPRRKTDLASLLTRALDRPAEAEAEGPNAATQREAIVAALVGKSASGDLGATKLLF